MVLQQDKTPFSFAEAWPDTKFNCFRDSISGEKIIDGVWLLQEFITLDSRINPHPVAAADFTKERLEYFIFLG